MAAETVSTRRGNALTAAEWRAAAGLAACVLALHVAGFATLLVLVVPQHLSLGREGVFGIGLGLTAYTLGLRHAFDADHIAAIDNTTRAFMARGRRTLSVGFFFSLGHSTVVFVLALLFAAGVRTISGGVRNDDSTLHDVTGVIGPSVSGLFLYVIAALNLAVLVGLVRTLRRVRPHECSPRELAATAPFGGPMTRVLGRFTRSVREPWHMYPLGVLFGLGFDTATEVALLFLAAGAASSGLPFYAILCLPVLFAAGMSLLDTIDGTFMNFAYGWALSNPVRKAFYNLAVTGLSVAVALVIGTIELSSVLAERLGLSGGLWAWLTAIDLNAAGLFVVGLFAAVWLLALLVWRLVGPQRPENDDPDPAGRMRIGLAEKAD
jgi:high-affinity nickel-transport protein